MAIYWVKLNKEQEKFLDLYLTAFPLRPEHRRRHYPGLIAKNFINSMMKRRVDVEKVYEKKYKEKYKER